MSDQKTTPDDTSTDRAQLPEGAANAVKDEVQTSQPRPFVPLRVSGYNERRGADVFPWLSRLFK
jgi:hypothetical protein